MTSRPRKARCSGTVARIGARPCPDNPSTAADSAAVTAATEKIGQDVRVFKISGVNEVAGVFAEMVKLLTGALLLGAGPLFTNNRQHLVDSAA